MSISIEMDLIIKLASDRRRERISAASSRHATDTVLGIAAKHVDAVVRIVASRNPRASEKVLMSMLMNDIRFERNNYIIRNNIACNPGSTRRVLLKLLEVCWNHPEISFNITKHPNADRKFVNTVFKSANSGIRSLAVLCPSASEAILLKAIRDEDGSVRRNAVSNIGATEKVLLAAMEVGELAAMAARHPNATNKVFDLAIKSNSLMVLGSAVKNPYATAEVLVSGVLNGHDTIRYDCASHHRATRQVLEIAARDRCCAVRCAVASNSKTTYEIWKSLLKDRNPKVKKSLMDHPKAEKWSDPMFSLLQTAKQKATMVA